MLLLLAQRVATSRVPTELEHAVGEERAPRLHVGPLSAGALHRVLRDRLRRSSLGSSAPDPRAVGGKSILRARGRAALGDDADPSATARPRDARGAPRRPHRRAAVRTRDALGLRRRSARRRSLLGRRASRRRSRPAVARSDRAAERVVALLAPDARVVLSGLGDGGRHGASRPFVDDPLRGGHTALSRDEPDAAVRRARPRSAAPRGVPAGGRARRARTRLTPSTRPTTDDAGARRCAAHQARSWTRASARDSLLWTGPVARGGTRLLASSLAAGRRIARAALVAPCASVAIPPPRGVASGRARHPAALVAGAARFARRAVQPFSLVRGSARGSSDVPRGASGRRSSRATQAIVRAPVRRARALLERGTACVIATSRGARALWGSRGRAQARSSSRQHAADAHDVAIQYGLEVPQTSPERRRAVHRVSSTSHAATPSVRSSWPRSSSPASATAHRGSRLVDLWSGNLRAAVRLADPTVRRTAGGSRLAVDARARRASPRHGQRTAARLLDTWSDAVRVGRGRCSRT